MHGELLALTTGEFVVCVEKTDAEFYTALVMWAPPTSSYPAGTRISISTRDISDARTLPFNADARASMLNGSSPSATAGMVATGHTFNVRDPDVGVEPQSENWLVTAVQGVEVTATNGDTITSFSWSFVEKCMLVDLLISGRD